jgi:hypothetical protein
MNQIRGSKQLQIGALIFPGVDQIDFTGPFEIFSRLPGATYNIIAKDKKPIRDTRGLILTPEKTYSEISWLDLLHVPGGPGHFFSLHWSIYSWSGRFAGGEKSDNPLGSLSLTKLLWRHSNQRASGFRWEAG